MKRDMKITHENVPDPKVSLLADLFNKTEDTKRLVDKLGQQIIYIANNVNQTKAYMTVLSYLFARGVTAFAFQKMLLIAPNEVRTYVKTDKGLFAVHIREENEMMKIESTIFDNEKEYYNDMKDWLTLLEENAPGAKKSEIQKQIEAIP